MESLHDKVAIVTGSSSGIGEAVARAFAEDGARVVVNSSRSIQAGESLAASLPDAIYVRADISVEADCHRLVEAAMEKWGRLDILVNNAGTTTVISHGDLDAATDEVWDRILRTNVMGTWYMSRAAVEALRADGGGSIINMTSLAGVRPTGSSIPYAVSKAALNHMTLLLANVLGPQVRVNAVAPGLVDTPWTESWDHIREGWKRVTPMARSATPGDIADVCMMLAKSTFLTGQVIVADAGITLRMPS
jgi:ketoreductase RED2